MEKDDPSSNRLQFSKWRIARNTCALSREAEQKLLLYCSVDEHFTHKELPVLDDNLLYQHQILQHEYSHLCAMFHVWGQDKLNDLCRSRP